MPEFSVSKHEKTEGVEKMKSMLLFSTIANVIGMVIKTSEKFLGGVNRLPTDSVRKASNVGPQSFCKDSSENSPVETTPTMMFDPFK